MLSQSTLQKQSQKLSPLQLQMLNLLHLSSQELVQKIKDELVDNPALETGTEENENTNDEQEENDFDPSEDFSDFYEQYDDEIPQYKLNDTFSQHEEESYFIPFANYSTFYEKIKEQVSMLNLNEKDIAIANFLIDSLDDDGYLRSELEELSFQYSFANGTMVEEVEMENILKIIQTCDPVGIGARNLKECLLIQLDRKRGTNKTIDIAYNLLTEYASELENRNYSKILKTLKISSQQLKDAIFAMTKLNPKPNVIADTALNINHITPEFSVTAIDNELIVSLTNKYIPEVKLNPKIVEMMRTLGDSKKEGVRKKQDRSTITFMKSKISSAQWLVDALKQRENTMLNIINVISILQYDFFMTGDFKDLKPMILKNVADKAGLDISSISRVTSNKYVQSDFGTFLLKELFSEGLSTQSGEMVSNKEIQNIIQNMLAKENKDNPYTDFQISELLQKNGYKVARRTVAKYRDCLKISGAKLRRVLA